MNIAVYIMYCYFIAYGISCNGLIFESIYLYLLSMIGSFIEWVFQSKCNGVFLICAHV